MFECHFQNCIFRGTLLSYTRYLRSVHKRARNFVHTCHVAACRVQVQSTDRVRKHYDPFHPEEVLENRERARQPQRRPHEEEDAHLHQDFQEIDEPNALLPVSSYESAYRMLETEAPAVFLSMQ